MSSVRIEGVQLEPRQQIRVALQQIYGIGNTRAVKICKQVGVSVQTKVKDLGEAEVKNIKAAVSKFTTEGDLRREVGMRIKRLVDVGCYRGKRHRAGLPVRGQRTRTNARTRKGPRGNQIKRVKGKEK